MNLTKHYKNKFFSKLIESQNAPELIASEEQEVVPEKPEISTVELTSFRTYRPSLGWHPDIMDERNVPQVLRLLFNDAEWAQVLLAMNEFQRFLQACRMRNIYPESHPSFGILRNRISEIMENHVLSICTPLPDGSGYVIPGSNLILLRPLGGGFYDTYTTNGIQAWSWFFKLPGGNVIALRLDLDIALGSESHQSRLNPWGFWDSNNNTTYYEWSSKYWRNYYQYFFNITPGSPDPGRWSMPWLNPINVIPPDEYPNEPGYQFPAWYGNDSINQHWA